MPRHTGAQQGHPRAQGEQQEIPGKKCELRLPENPRDLVSRDPNPPGQARTQRVSIRPQSPPQTTRSLVCRGGREGLTACPCSRGPWLLTGPLLASSGQRAQRAGGVQRRGRSRSEG